MKLRILFYLSLIALTTITYAYFIEPYNLQVREIVIPDSKLYKQWGDIRIAQLSDLHITKISHRDKSLLKKLSQLKPDLIVVTGDSAQWNEYPENALKFLKELRAPFGVYCVMGDADFSSCRHHCLFCHPDGDYHRQRKQPHFIRNNIIETCLGRKFDNHRITIVGIAEEIDWGSKQDFVTKIDKDAGKSRPLLILDHFSHQWESLASCTNHPILWLAGDTHGGQILLPDFIWKMLKIKPDPTHMAGLFRKGRHKWLYVNRGIGTTRNFPFRLGVRPEITILSFKEEDKPI